MGSLVAPFIKRPPAKQETWVQFLGWEDTLEKEMATHCRILVFLAGKFYGQRSLMGYIAQGVARVRNNLVTQPSPPWIKRKSKNHVWEQWKQAVPKSGTWLSCPGSSNHHFFIYVTLLKMWGTNERSSWLSSGTVTGSWLDQKVGGRIWLTRPFSICHRKIPPKLLTGEDRLWPTWSYGALRRGCEHLYTTKCQKVMLIFSFDHDSLISSVWQWLFIQKEIHPTVQEYRPTCSTKDVLTNRQSCWNAGVWSLGHFMNLLHLQPSRWHWSCQVDCIVNSSLLTSVLKFSHWQKRDNSSHLTLRWGF